VKSPTDGLQHWIVASQDFRHYDAERWRNGGALALDYKFSDTSQAWVRVMDSSYTEKNQQWLTTFPFGAGTVSALTDTTATVSIKANGIIKSMAQIGNNKRVSSMVGGFDSSNGPWTNNLKVGYTTSKYTRPTATIAYANTTATVVSYAFDSPYDNIVTQVSGPSIGNPASYAFSTKSSYSNTTANMHEETVRDDLRYDFNLDGLPAYVTGGAEYRHKNNNIDTSKWAITSLPANPWSSLAANVYPGFDTQDTLGGFPNFQIRQESVSDFFKNGANYGQTLTASTTYGGAFMALENIAAAYAMGGVTAGKLKVMAGVRAEDTHFWIDGWQFDATTSVATPYVAQKDYTNVLPTAIFTYEFTPNTIARASWSNTLARPNYNATAPGRTVNDVAKTVSQGNANLPALTAMNWDASLEHYYSPLGLVSAAVYYKSIKNFNYQALAGTDPATGYQLTTYLNAPSAWIYGAELSWAQRLGFLPEPFNGLGFQANLLLGSSHATYPTRPGESLPFMGYGHEEGNVALTYDHRGLHLRVAEHFHDARLLSRSVIGADATGDEHEDAYHTIDFGGSYTFRRHWQIYLNAANLNNAPLLEYFQGPNSPKRIDTYERYGWSAESGMRWNY
jgi:TonB-dependent receptor